MTSSIDFTLLAEVLDSIEDAFCVADSIGRIRYENGAFEEIMAGAGDPELVRDEVRRLARGVIVGDASVISGTEWATGRASEFQVRRATYRARASLMRKSSADSLPLALVTLETSASTRVPEHVRVKHRLTPREAQVMELLAEGHSNQDVAEALGVSTHTARHHTGRVLSKLRARGRAEVGAMVRRLLA